MLTLTEQGRQIVTAQAAQHHVSEETVVQLLTALQRGGGRQAQFNVTELGGMGQWLQGGMIMIGDMFNTALKARVLALCQDLAEALQTNEVFAANSSSIPQAQPNFPWSADLGQPASQGSQNDMKYAWFPQKRRLAVMVDGQVTIYDSGEHQISGFGQSQGSKQSLSFTSQNGTLPVSHLTVVPREPAETEEDSAKHLPADEIYDSIIRLAELRKKGALTDAEFAAKRSALLGRL